MTKLKTSERIRARIQAAGARFHANDNIADFIESPAELHAVQDEVRTAIEALLDALIIDTESDHNTHDTARRVAKMFIQEVYRGRYQPMPALTEFPNVSQLSELMVVGPITLRSSCSHHMVPILGKTWIGIMPNKDSNLIGLSKYSRLAEWVMSRPQIQEEAISQLADLLEARIKPDGVAIVMKADHLCMQWRGVKDITQMTSSIMRGSFLSDNKLRKEFLSLLSLG